MKTAPDTSTISAPRALSENAAEPGGPAFSLSGPDAAALHGADGFPSPCPSDPGPLTTDDQHDALELTREHEQAPHTFK